MAPSCRLRPGYSGCKSLPYGRSHIASRESHAMYKTDTNCHAVVTKCDKAAVSKLGFEQLPRPQVAENTYLDQQ
jgi:hypothetical protein